MEQRTIDWFLVLLVLLGAASVIGPWWYLDHDASRALSAKEQLVLSSVQAAIVLMLGIRWEHAQAERRAAEQWLRQAESAVDGLLKVRADVLRMRDEILNTCSSACQSIPGLDEREELRAARNWMKQGCDWNALQLLSVVGQVDKAINDWSLYIRANCTIDMWYRVSRSIAVARGEPIPDPPPRELRNKRCKTC